jgi:hypothetical protein
VAGIIKRNKLKPKAHWLISPRLELFLVVEKEKQKRAILPRLLTDFSRTGANKFSRKRLSIKTKLNRLCALCGRHIPVNVYQDGSYRGGEYFGKMPEFAMRKRPGGFDPAITDEVWKHSDEYWECSECCCN